MNFTTPSKELTLQMPWSMACKTAVLALLTDRTFEQQLEVQLEDGMRILEEKRK